MRETNIGMVNHGTATIHGDVSGKRTAAAERPSPGAAELLVVTALEDELDAAKLAAAGTPGVRHWKERTAGGVPYLAGVFETLRGRSLQVALARPTRMGGRPTGATAATLAGALKPRCLAMSGVCAGSPDWTVPGDVVIADRVYEYDEGKQRATYFEGDIQQYPQDDQWVYAAQAFRPGTLPSFGAAGETEARHWLLERLARGEDPVGHVARVRYFSPGTWQTWLDRLVQDGLVRCGYLSYELTAAGDADVRRRRFQEVEPPQRLPFAVQVGPMASGSAVMEDPKIWERLRRMGVRTIAALDMEAATIATIAHNSRIPHWFVAKGVMDQAEAGRDDRYRAFAARASAEVLWSLLPDLLTDDRT